MYRIIIYRGVEQLAARRAHNPKVVSSSLTPATKEYITRTVTVLVIFYILKIGYDNALKWHYYVKLGKNWVK